MKQVLRLLFPKEVKRPEAAFDAVIGEKKRRYAELRGAIAEVLFLRNKLEGELLERRAEVARIHADAKRSVKAGREVEALTHLERMNRAKEGLRALEEELALIEREADGVKVDLAELGDAIRTLERERAEAGVRLRSAGARKRVRALLSDAGRAGEEQRLEAVRALVLRTSAEADLDRELHADPLADAEVRLELARLTSRALQRTLP